MQEKESYLLALTAVQKAGPVTISRIIQFFGDTKSPFSARREDLLRVEGMQEAIADEILRIDPVREADMLLKDSMKAGAQILTIFNEDYPALLKEIHAPPPVLYCKGQIDKNPKIAIVGTRRASPYGRSVSEMLAGELSSAGFTIVSGLARGIDTAAHAGTLGADGGTIAVLGSGFNHVYPKENRKFAEQITERGALITEFPPDILPLPENFPRRNRIISGLSIATIVIEAEEKSGALITANYALEQGREVFAVPGNITSRKSMGPNLLIKQGATPALSAGDILSELPSHLLPGDATASAFLSPDTHLERALPHMRVVLDADEHKIFSLLSVDDPLHIDRIAELSRMSMNRLLSAILSLEIKGVVDQLPGNHYIKKLRYEPGTK